MSNLNTMTTNTDMSRRGFLKTMGIATLGAMMLGSGVSLAMPGEAMAASLVGVKVKGTQHYSAAKSVIAKVNEKRAAKGLPKLVAKKELMDLAMKRAAELSVYYGQNHSRPDGSVHAAQEILNKYIKSGSAAENIAANYASAADVVAGWWGSTGHKNNILGKNFCYTGVGSFKVDGVVYWVQVFSTKNGSKNPYTTYTWPSTTTPTVTKTVNILPSLLTLGVCRKSGSRMVTGSSLAVSKGKSEQLYLCVRNSGTGTFSSIQNAATWKTSNSSVAKVTTAGKVTGVKAGSATITATALGKKGTVGIAVK